MGVYWAVAGKAKWKFRLDPDATYRIGAIVGCLAADTPTDESGVYWMEHGVDLELSGDFQAAAFSLERAPAKAKRL